MNVAISDFRANMRSWLDRVRQGESVVLTDRGLPVATVIGADVEDLRDRLRREGVVITPAQRPKRKIDPRNLIKAKGSVSEYIIEERDRRR